LAKLGGAAIGSLPEIGRWVALGNRGAFQRTS
jgi:hypothetical protein